MTSIRPGFRVLVTGSRTWQDPAPIEHALQQLYEGHGETLVVVHGACPRGADAIAARWCDRAGVAVEEYPADWTPHGRAGGFRRNATMVATHPKLCLAFIRNASPGATHCARLAEAAGIPTVRHADRPDRDSGPPAPRPAQRRLPADRYLTAALGYGAAGWPVFLLGRRKRPVANCRACPKARDDPSHDPAACPCLTCHGPYAASTDPNRIRAIFEAIPDGLLALATGTASGIVVVDIDPRNGGRVDPALMPPTRCSATGNDGWHLFYRHPGTAVPNSQGRIAPGVDVRGEGGYAVLPPSIHPYTHRAYRWANTRPLIEMPPPLVVANRPAPATDATRATAGRTNSGGGGISNPAALLAANLDKVRTSPGGTRRVTLYGASRGVARIVATGALTPPDARNQLTAVGREVGQPERDIRAAIEGGFRDEGVCL